ncbi:MAG TPA: 1-acyl-sn-glycerol-3-phosphate acyltransferase [Longimicrobiaceae bacterium]|nr:1-acyl-sn-glycerol-3-phosphate acyltransferase [Longimicrobiaceae bacterium]
MWLLPFFSGVSRFAVRTFYRLQADGPHVPHAGPVLLVANHPNSLLDPAMVVAVARRPVRFLAKAPLFTDPMVGWLIRASGSIPVHRKVDGEVQAGANDDTFRAVHDALAHGSAVGIFPEGTSHSEPSLVPLKTGAARIALGAVPRVGGPFPIIPVGLSLRDKEIFRSDVIVIAGRAVAWDDLAGAGEDDVAAVRELTRRIDAALHEVTVNLERWEDSALVEAAAAIYAAEFPAPRRPATRVAVAREASERLSVLRGGGHGEWKAVAREVRGHARMLGVLGLTPTTLQRAAEGRGSLAAWTASRLAFFALGAPIAAVGMAVFWIPYRLTGVVEQRFRPMKDVRATYKVLVGGLLHLLWIALLAIAAGIAAGPWAAAAALIGLPLVGLTTLRVIERWAVTTAQARRFLLRATRRRTLAELRERQRLLGLRLRDLYEGVPA